MQYEKLRRTNLEDIFPLWSSNFSAENGEEYLLSQSAGV
jgi:hypothetical protein